MIFTVAIDGPAASGKGTIAKALARELGFAHLDTGLLYRAVAAKSLEGQDPVEAAQGLDPGGLDGARLRTAAVAQEASRVAAIPAVRVALLDVQKAFARREGGAVMDGRDIGTVICPEAEAKLFVTASAEARAGRRYRELVAAGQEVTLEGTLAEVRARDARDAGRDVAPLRPAGDAVVIDTSGLGIEEAVSAALAVVRERLGR
ncbi:Cytidylate kinase [Rubellimicrobium mesophilum DSM 19309]|uniref:Cytidylate kinase n=1 Tax=Rubellimicrobium mesophilum DSM 19309 TaxID=442562 RepID=A0A017HB88_9RHOB|nr:d(CMP) kinase [Rubellimicrobium mesophilum]EYD71550.1 Cytidylate kinase [Rubellimicrobium mesophilum DSM 19309]